MKSSGSLTPAGSNPASGAIGDKMGSKRSNVKDTYKEDEKKRMKDEDKAKHLAKDKKKVEGKQIIRMMGSDIDANKGVAIALTGIKGVGDNFASAVTHVADIDSSVKLIDLSEVDRKKIEEIIRNPVEHNIPSWMTNRRKDMVSGKDVHLIESDLLMSWREDINILKKIRAYRGIRHERGLPVRGQRTKSSFRKGKKGGTVKKKAQPIKSEKS